MFYKSSKHCWCCDEVKLQWMGWSVLVLGWSSCVVLARVIAGRRRRSNSQKAVSSDSPQLLPCVRVCSVRTNITRISTNKIILLKGRNINSKNILLSVRQCLMFVFLMFEQWGVVGWWCNRSRLLQERCCDHSWGWMILTSRSPAAAWLASTVRYPTNNFSPETSSRTSETVEQSQQ